MAGVADTPLRVGIARLLASLLALCLLAGCYTRHGPVQPPVVDVGGEAGGEAPCVPLTLGVVAAGSAQVGAVGVDALVAEQLSKARLFCRVIHPWSSLAPLPADAILEVSASGVIDELPIRNVLRQALVGFSLLLLQPVMPVERDLSVTVSARLRRDGADLADYSDRRTSRLAYTHFQASDDAVAMWIEDTAAAAARGLVDEMKADARVRELAAARSP